MKEAILSVWILGLLFGKPDIENRAAIKVGSKALLQARVNWKWAPFSNAEAIQGLTLATAWYSLGSADAVASVEAMYNELLVALSKDSNLTSDPWAHGKLAQYVLAVKLTCRDPSKFANYNLLTIVRQHMIAEEAYWRDNRFSLAWTFIARCDQGGPDSAKEILTENPGQYKYGVGEASMVLMASICLKGVENSPAIDAAIEGAEKYITEELTNNFAKYNVYSKGLAAQALIASKSKGVQLIEKTLKSIAEVVLKENDKLMKFPGAGSQILPALARKSYIDAFRKNDCDAVSETTSPGTPSTSPGPDISIAITVTDEIVKHTNDTWPVTFPSGDTLFDAMETLQQQSSNFSFQYTSSSFGAYITTINDVMANTTLKQFWEISLVGKGPLKTGVSSTYPEDGQVYLFNLTTWT